MRRRPDRVILPGTRIIARRIQSARQVSSCGACSWTYRRSRLWASSVSSSSAEFASKLLQDSASKEHYVLAAKPILIRWDPGVVSQQLDRLVSSSQGLFVCLIDRGNSYRYGGLFKAEYYANRIVGTSCTIRGRSFFDVAIFLAVGSVRRIYRSVFIEVQPSHFELKGVLVLEVHNKMLRTLSFAVNDSNFCV